MPNTKNHHRPKGLEKANIFTGKKFLGAVKSPCIRFGMKVLSIYLSAILVFCVIFACTSIPVMYEEPIPDAFYIDRENITPDRITLDNLEAVSAQVRDLRQLIIDMDGPTLFPEDWKELDLMYNLTGQQEKTSTLRETQESIARYNVTNNAFKALNVKTMSRLYGDDVPEYIAERQTGINESYQPVQPVVIAPEVAQPEVVQPVVIVPEVVQPEIVQPVVIAPEVVQPEVVTPEVVQPEVVQPVAVPQVVITPEVAQLEVVTPEVVIPEVVQPVAVPQVIEPVPEIVQTPAATPVREGRSFPAQYKVRSWKDYKDCFWNIAAKPWVFNDPRKWRLLYEANKDRLPNPDNPNLILEGMILIIPSINGEIRDGMWDKDQSYPEFK